MTKSKEELLAELNKAAPPKGAEGEGDWARLSNGRFSLDNGATWIEVTEPGVYEVEGVPVAEAREEDPVVGFKSNRRDRRSIGKAMRSARRGRIRAARHLRKAEQPWTVEARERALNAELKRIADVEIGDLNAALAERGLPYRVGEEQ